MLWPSGNVFLTYETRSQCWQGFEMNWSLFFLNFFMPVSGKVPQMNELQSSNIILPHYQLWINWNCLSTRKLGKVAPLVISKWQMTIKSHVYINLSFSQNKAWKTKLRPQCRNTGPCRGVKLWIKNLIIIAQITKHTMFRTLLFFVKVLQTTLVLPLQWPSD